MSCSWLCSLQGIKKKEAKSYLLQPFWVARCWRIHAAGLSVELSWSIYKACETREGGSGWNSDIVQVSGLDKGRLNGVLPNLPQG